MMKKLGSVVLVGLLLLNTPIELVEGKTVEYQERTVEFPVNYGGYDHYPIEIEVPNDSCKKRFKDIVIKTEECPTTSVITYVRLPAVA